jgi:hypothetical protein
MPKEAFMFFEQSGVKDTGRKKWWAELPLQQNHFSIADWPDVMGLVRKSNYLSCSPTPVKSVIYVCTLVGYCLLRKGYTPSEGHRPTSLST